MVNPCKSPKEIQDFLLSQTLCTWVKFHLRRRKKTPHKAFQKCPNVRSREAPGLSPNIFWRKVLSPYLSKTAHHLLHQRPHGGDVDDLEVIHVDSAIHVNVLPYLSEHRHQGHVGLTSTLWEVKDKKACVPHYAHYPNF